MKLAGERSNCIWFSSYVELSLRLVCSSHFAKGHFTGTQQQFWHKRVHRRFHWSRWLQRWPAITRPDTRAYSQSHAIRETLTSTLFLCKHWGVASNSVTLPCKPHAILNNTACSVSMANVVLLTQLHQTIEPFPGERTSAYRWKAKSG